jgi:ABC-2 type transport system ATP-binding protein
VIQVEDLSKAYGAVTAVSHLTFSVGAGEILGLIGPNGAGKTSTLRCLVGIHRPSSGRVLIAGHDLTDHPVEAKRHLAFFADEPHLFEYLTVAEHLRLTARIFQMADAEAKSEALLEELELTAKRDTLPGALSRGMKQKVAIAAGLLHDPSVMLFDEPLTGLDPLGIRRMKDSILKRAQAGAAIILSSHLLHLLEEVCSHVLILKRGEKIADGTIAEIRARFGNGDAHANLEDVFIRATGGTES